MELNRVVSIGMEQGVIDSRWRRDEKHINPLIECFVRARHPRPVVEALACSSMFFCFQIVECWIYLC